jgi:hypothetical protein
MVGLEALQHRNGRVGQFIAFSDLVRIDGRAESFVED